MQLSRLLYGPELNGVTHVSVMAIICSFLGKEKINASSLVKFALFTSDSHVYIHAKKLVGEVVINCNVMYV